MRIIRLRKVALPTVALRVTAPAGTLKMNATPELSVTVSVDEGLPLAMYFVVPLGVAVICAPATELPAQSTT